MTTKQPRETIDWIALTTHATPTEQLIEAGGIYPSRLTRNPGFRHLQPGEQTATCPRCGQRFAAVDVGTAEENRDLHVTGDEDCPSICREARHGKLGRLSWRRFFGISAAKARFSRRIGVPTNGGGRQRKLGHLVLRLFGRRYTQQGEGETMGSVFQRKRR